MTSDPAPLRSASQITLKKQFHREFQSFLYDHIPLRKSIAWQDWYANRKFEVQADEITFSMEPGSHSKSLL